MLQREREREREREAGLGKANGANRSAAAGRVTDESLSLGELRLETVRVGKS